MPNSTPDWSALASQNERLADAGDAAVAAGSDGRRSGPANLAVPIRRRLARGAAAGTAAALAMTGAVALSAATDAAAAATPAHPSWQIVKRVPSGNFGDFTAIAPVGTNGAWAFNGTQHPAAWRRSGATWKKYSFPFMFRRGEYVVAAGATSPSNAWAFVNGGGDSSRAVHWNGRRWTPGKTFPERAAGAVALSRTDVWLFGTPQLDGPGMGAWHFNGHSWARVASGHGLQGGSALSGSDIWSFSGTSVAHWNSRAWNRYSVRALLPRKAKRSLNDPAITAVYAQSRDSVWVVGNGNGANGPLVVLHYNGRTWRRTASSKAFAGDSALDQVAPDGHGGLWIPTTGVTGLPSRLVHYSGGHLRAVRLPADASHIAVGAIASVPHSEEVLSGGYLVTGGSSPRVVAVVLQYGS